MRFHHLAFQILLGWCRVDFLESLNEMVSFWSKSCGYLFNCDIPNLCRLSDLTGMTGQIHHLIRLLIFFVLVRCSVGWSSWSLLGVVRLIFVLVLYSLESLGHLQELFKSKIWNRQYHCKIYTRLMHLLTLNVSLALISQSIISLFPWCCCLGPCWYWDL